MGDGEGGEGRGDEQDDDAAEDDGRLAHVSPVEEGDHCNTGRPTGAGRGGEDGGNGGAARQDEGRKYCTSQVNLDAQFEINRTCHSIWRYNDTYRIIIQLLLVASVHCRV